MVAVVGAGDMLVVPPFWFHHVETLEESVSVNVWSNAPEYALINRMYEILSANTSHSQIIFNINHQTFLLLV